MHLINNMAPAIIQAIQDAIKFNQNILNRETLKNIEEHEEYLMTLWNLLMHAQDEYKKIENEVGIPLSELIGRQE